jgi:2-polyprenyl-3-methyl-5-hydroxy-6-metoxy-1,4-benzoquinol methylase
VSEGRIFHPKLLARLKAPGHSDECELEELEGALRCVRSGETFPFVSGIPSLYAKPEAESNAVTGKVRSFYEEHPFPSYEGLEEFGELVNKGYHNPFTTRLLRAVGYNKLVLECGCGTGQMSQFLQLNNNCVLGIDLSLASLGLAMEHKLRNQLERSAFAQMNIFDLAIKDDSFDVVISHGVLHHTYDARKAFSHIVRKAKPGGIVMVGLYNSYARIPTWIRARLIGLFGNRIDYVVRSRIRDARKAEIWVKDQYYNPHETWHSIGEVLRWFEENDVEFLNVSPPVLGEREEPEDLFGAGDRGTPGRRVLTQLAWLFTISREGALFDVIGRRRA